jgi:hypothetical protein
LIDDDDYDDDNNNNNNNLMSLAYGMPRENAQGLQNHLL